MLQRRVPYPAVYVVKMMTIIHYVHGSHKVSIGQEIEEEKDIVESRSNFKVNVEKLAGTVTLKIRLFYPMLSVVDNAEA